MVHLKKWVYSPDELTPETEKYLEKVLKTMTELSKYKPSQIQATSDSKKMIEEEERELKELSSMKENMKKDKERIEDAGELMIK